MDVEISKHINACVLVGTNVTVQTTNVQILLGLKQLTPLVITYAMRPNINLHQSLMLSVAMNLGNLHVLSTVAIILLIYL